MFIFLACGYEKWVCVLISAVRLSKSNVFDCSFVLSSIVPLIKKDLTRALKLIFTCDYCIKWFVKSLGSWAISWWTYQTTFRPNLSLIWKRARSIFRQILEVIRLESLVFIIVGIWVVQCASLWERIFALLKVTLLTVHVATGKCSDFLLAW